MARKHPQVIAHHATSAANNPQPPPRRYRERRQLTQEQLAERAGLSVGEIIRLERGVRRSPKVQTLYLLGRGAAPLPSRAGRAGDSPVSRCAPAAAPGNHPCAVRSS